MAILKLFPKNINSAHTLIVFVSKFCITLAQYCTLVLQRILVQSNTVKKYKLVVKKKREILS